MLQLVKKKCKPCHEKDTKTLSYPEAESYQKETPEWLLEDDASKIRKSFLFKDFLEAMAFINSVATIAEDEGHHPDIFVSYNKVVIELWTHSINGLSENDFIVAAKIDELEDQGQQE